MVRGRLHQLGVGDRALHFLPVPIVSPVPPPGPGTPVAMTADLLRMREVSARPQTARQPPPGEPVLGEGGTIGAPRRNGQEGSCAANEGVSMLSIRKGVHAHGA